jgi:hypothetical protein
MESESNSIIQFAKQLINTEKANDLFNLLKNTSNTALTMAKSSTAAAYEKMPSKEQIDQSVAALQDALGTLRINMLQGATAATSMYQRAVNSEQTENLVAWLRQDKTPEQLQRRLEKILYLYLLDYGITQVRPPINIDVASKGELVKFYKEILKKNSASEKAVKEMVRNLLMLFYNERLGVSAVEYNQEFNDKELSAVYTTIIKSSRTNEIINRVDELTNNNRFIEEFLKAVVNDVPNNIANDSKYFGHSYNFVANARLRLFNFLNEHNTYVTTYIKSGVGLENEILKLDRLYTSLTDAEPFAANAEQKDEVVVLKELIQNMQNSIRAMLVPVANGKLRVYEFKGLDYLLDSPKAVNAGDGIIIDVVEPTEGNTTSRKRKVETTTRNDTRGKPRARMDIPVDNSESDTEEYTGGKTSKRRRRISRAGGKRSRKRSRKTAKRRRMNRRRCTRGSK